MEGADQAEFCSCTKTRVIWLRWASEVGVHILSVHGRKSRYKGRVHGSTSGPCINEVPSSFKVAELWKWSAAWPPWALGVWSLA
jgi:hypothetical protein